METIDEHGLLKLSGSIEHVIYSNEENGFAICVSAFCATC